MSDGLDINRSLKPAQKITHIRDYQAGISTCLITQFGLVSTHLILRIGRTIQWELSLTPTSHAYATAVQTQATAVYSYLQTWQYTPARV